jgi:hypothetical protein
LGETVKTSDAERLMKACQIGVGGRGALDKAHDIMAACYGTIGSLVAERDRLLQEVTRMRRGEAICTKCGHRQNDTSGSIEEDPFPF